MIRLISDRKDFKEKEYLHDFFSRIKILIIMSKAFLGGYPLDPKRLEEIIDAADRAIKDCVEWKGRVQNFRSMARWSGTCAVTAVRVKTHPKKIH